MAQSKRTVRLAAANLGESRHVCAFFRTSDEAYRVLLPFAKEGLRTRPMAIVGGALQEMRNRRAAAARA